MSDAFKAFKERIAGLWGKVRGKETLKDIVEEEAEKEHQEDQEEQQEDLTPQENETALKGAYKSFRSPGLPKTDVDTYIEKITPHTKTLIEQQIREMRSAKVQLCMWIKWKKEEELSFDEEEFKEEGIDPAGLFRTIVEKAFNNKMMEIFQGSNIDEILEKMFAYIKTQTENPKFPKSSFTLDSIMHLDISFHKLELTQGSSYIDLPAWIVNKKAVINPQNEDEKCFKWAVITALHHEDIKNNRHRISNLEPYSDLYNWKGLEFPMTVSKIDKFEKNNPDIAVNVLYLHHPKEGKSKGKITILQRSDGNTSRSKVVNLLLITDNEKSHYKAIKSLSRLLRRKNSKRKGEYYFCINCLNAFHSQSSRDKHYGNCIDHEAIKTEMPQREEDKWVQYHDGQKQFKVPFIMYADFENHPRTYGREQQRAS